MTTTTSSPLIFVSYATRDVSRSILDNVAEAVCSLGEPFVDRLSSLGRRPQATIQSNLNHAAVFVAVTTSNYLSTYWTRLELTTALRRGTLVLQIDPKALVVMPFDRYLMQKLQA